MKQLFLPFLLLATDAIFAQKVTGTIHLTKGQKLEVTTNMNMNVQSMMGESSGNIIMIEIDSVGNAAANNIVLIKIPKHIKASFSMMGRDIPIDTDKPNDLDTPFGQPFKEMMKQRIEYTIDANGKIVAVKEDKKNKNDNGAVGMMIPGMSMGSAVPQVGMPSFLKILPDKEASKGDTWTDSVNIEGTKDYTSYTLKDVTDKEILVDYVENGTNITTQNAMGITMDMNTKFKSTGGITIDKATGILKQKTATTTSESTMNMNGNEINSKVKTTVVTSVKIL